MIDDDFLKKYEIDYVAHDEVPYASPGHDDVYGSIKSQGAFPSTFPSMKIHCFILSTRDR